MVVQSSFQLHIELQVYQDLGLKSDIGIVLLLPELQERQAQCFHLCSLALELDAFLAAEHASGQEGSKSGRRPMLPVETFFKKASNIFMFSVSFPGPRTNAHSHKMLPKATRSDPRYLA